MQRRLALWLSSWLWRSPNFSVSWLTLYGLVDRFPVSAGNFRRELQRHFLVDFHRWKDLSCSKRACFAFVNQARNVLNSVRSKFADASISRLFEGWVRSAASEALQRHLSIDFQNQDIIGKICSWSKRACFAFVSHKQLCRPRRVEEKSFSAVCLQTSLYNVCIYTETSKTRMS